MLKKFSGIIGLITALIFCPAIFASSSALNLYATHTTYGYITLAIFFLAYALVILEEKTHFRKSKPVVIAAGIIWIIVALICKAKNLEHDAASEAVKPIFLHFTEMLLFLLVAMTYVNTMEERNVFTKLRAWLIDKGFSYRQCFWATGILAFFISPVADNLTTALLMCAVAASVGAKSPKFMIPACINIVVAANAGGAFSPFGDITTLMVWQKGILPFEAFFRLFVPAAVNFVVPAVIMMFAIPNEKPPISKEKVIMKKGAKTTIILFLLIWRNIIYLQVNVLLHKNCIISIYLIPYFHKPVPLLDHIVQYYTNFTFQL